MDFHLGPDRIMEPYEYVGVFPGVGDLIQAGEYWAVAMITLFF